MRWKESLVLVVTAVVLAWYVYTSEIRPTSAVGSLADLQAQAQKVFYELGGEVIEEVVIDRGEGDVLAFRRAGQDWDLTEPIRARAATGNVRTLVSMLVDLKRWSAMEVEDLSKWGLSTPALTVALRAGGKERTLGLGSPDATGKRRFARVMEAEGREVFLVDEVLARGMRLPLAAWQSTRVLRATKESIESIEVIPRSGTDGERVGFSRHGPRWRMMVPVAAPADGRKVEALIEKFAGLTADRQRGVVGNGEEEVTRWGLQSPLYTVKVLQTGGEELVVRFSRAVGPADPGSAERLLACASDYPVIFAVGGETESWLKVESAAFRSRRVMEMRPEEVEGFEVRFRGEDMGLVRERVGWALKAPREGRADGEAVEGFLEKLERLEANAFVPRSRETEGVAWESTVVLHGPSSDAREELQFGRREGDEALRVYVKSSSSEDILVTQTVLEALFPESYLAFRDRQLIDVDSTRVKGFELDRPERQYRVERDGQRWRLGLPVKGEADGENVERLVRAVTRLEVGRYVEDDVGDPERFGLAPGRITIRVDLGQMGNLSEETLTLCVGRGRGGGQCFASSSVAEGLVFTIGQETADALEAELANREVLHFEEEELVGIAVSGLRISQESGRWQAHSLEAGERLAQPKLAGMVYELAALRAERFASLGEDLDPGQYGLAPDEALALTLTFADGKERVVLVGDATESGGRLAMIQGEKRVFELSAETAKRVALRRGDLVER